MPSVLSDRRTGTGETPAPPLGLGGGPAITDSRTLASVTDAGAIGFENVTTTFAPSATWLAWSAGLICTTIGGVGRNSRSTVSPPTVTGVIDCIADRSRTRSRTLSVERIPAGTGKA